MALTADQHILVADLDGNAVLKFTLDGVYVEAVYRGYNTAPRSVTETEGGEVVVAEVRTDRFRILGPGRDEFLSPPDGGELRNAYAVTSRGRYVYALDTILKRVFVYE